MGNSFLKVSCLIPKLKISDIRFNAESILDSYQKNEDSSILVTPELSLCGYTCQDLFFQDAFLKEVEEALFFLAKNVHKNLLIVGAPLRKNNKLYNCAVFLSDGEIKGIIPKSFIPNYGEFYEARWFASGREIKTDSIFIKDKEIPFGTQILFKDKNSPAVISAEICEDLWVGEKPSTKACLNGANIICNLSASDENVSKNNYRRKLVEIQSSTLYCSYLYCSSSTDESSQDLVFSGHNMIVDNGTILKECIYPKAPYAISSIIDVDRSNFNRIHQSTFENRTDDYISIPLELDSIFHEDDSFEKTAQFLRKEQYSISRFPFVPSDEKERQARCLEILSIQAHGLATRVKNTGIKNLVIGISGGLDSTLALLVCNEARKMIKDIKILAITMPSEGMTTSLTKKNALALMKELDVEIKEIPIRKTFEMHLFDIGHSQNYIGEKDVTFENAQARMRTYILMDFANMRNGLVVGTGDLSELALGWCTYNGDHMSMYGVNSSVPKTLVQYIVTSYADTLADKKLSDTLHSIVDTPISPELTPNNNDSIAQKTEDRIGKYDLNDFFLFYFLRYGFSPKKILSLAKLAYGELDSSFLKKSLENFYRRFYSQHFKRSCLPDGVKVGSVTLSPRGDYRMPSDASVKTLLDELENC